MKQLERERTFLQKIVIYKNLPLKHIIFISYRPGTDVILFSQVLLWDSPSPLSSWYLRLFLWGKSAEASS
jgi:hypothetical protein